MRNRKLGTQIWIIAGLNWLVGGGSAGFLFYRLRNTVAAYEELFTRESQQQDLSRQMQVTFKKQVQEWKDVLIRGHEPAAFQRYTDGFHHDEARVREMGARLANEVADPAARALLEDFGKAHESLSVAYARALDEFRRSEGQDLRKADRMVIGQDRRPTDLIDQVVERLRQRTDRQRAAIASSLIAFAIGSSVCFVAVMAMSGWMVRRLNIFIRDTVVEIGKGTVEVASVATQVSSLSQALAQGTSDQASSLHQTSRSIEEITGIARETGGYSTSAAELMVAVTQGVGKANLALAELATSMRAIDASSREISKIIKLIDEIAFQTNILALNAAVEAARAGVAGTSFAVVADGVRNLARRSADAARNTAGLVEKSIQRSTDGSARLDRVSEAIGIITVSAQKARSAIDQVSGAGCEQNRSVEKIATAVTQMEQVTQNTAARAEQNAAAGEGLTTQAAGLHQLVARLRALV